MSVEVTGGLVEVVVFVLTFCLSLCFVRYFEKRKPADRNRPPCMPSLPLVGSLPFMANTDRLYHYFMEKSEELGCVFTFYAGSRLAVVLNGREAIHDALVNHAEDFADRSPLWTEENVLNKELRGITFKHYDKNFKKYHDLCQSTLGKVTSGINATSEARIMSAVQVAVEEIRTRHGEAFDPKDLLTDISGMIVLGVLLGERLLRSHSSRAREIIEHSSGYLANIDPAMDVMPLLRFIPTFRRKLEAMAAFKRILMECYEEELEKSLADDIDDSFVRWFAEMEGESELDRLELVYILRDLTFGGTVTVSTTLLWALVLLANHQEVQRRIREEIDSVVPRERLPSLEDKRRLPFAEASMLEVLRRKGATPFASTHSTLNDTQVQGLFVPAGCMVLVNLYSAHMNSKDWNDPESFRPERFLDENQSIIKKDHVIPFGLGPRSCIGETLARQEVFLLLCSVVQQFDIRPPDGLESISEEEIYKLAMCPAPFKIRLIPRPC